MGMCANMAVVNCPVFVTSYHLPARKEVVSSQKEIVMKTLRVTQVFLGLMGLAFVKVGIETLTNPQAVLDAVGIELNNPSAFSSMRAVYGGMHLMFGLFCLFGIWKDQRSALKLLVLYTGGFVIGRISGIMVDGMPNEFVSTWLVTEAFSGIISGLLLYLIHRPQSVGQKPAIV